MDGSLCLTPLPHIYIYQEIDGWLWFDEKDQVNVLARMAAAAPDAPPQPHNQQQQRQQKQQQGGAGQFLLFEQRKYGYEGLRCVTRRSRNTTTTKGFSLCVRYALIRFIHDQHRRSLAPIGGLIEPGEEPLVAAKRELLEEAGLGGCVGRAFFGGLVVHVYVYT